MCSSDLRSFLTGGLEARPRGESIEYHFDRYQKSVDFIGTVKAILAPQHIVVEIKTGFKKGDILELIPEQGAPVLIPSETITSLEGTPLERCQPNTLIKLPFSGSAKQYDLIRRPLQPALN